MLAGRLKPGLTVAGAAPRLDTLSRQLERAYPAENKEQLLTVSPLPRLGTSTSPSSDAGAAGAAAFMMALSAVVLFIACLNIANMLLARGASRRKEIAIRLAVGGGRGRIVRQLLTEGLLLSLAGAAGGLLLASWATGLLARSLAAVLPLGISFEPKPDAMVAAATTAFAVIATVIVGARSRAEIVEDRPGRRSEGAGRGRIAGARAPFLGAQRDGGRPDRAVADAPLGRRPVRARCVEGGLGESRLQLRPAAAGVHGSDARAVRRDRAGARVYRELLGRVRALPGVAAVGMAGSVPFGDFHEGHSVERVGGGASGPGGARQRRLPRHRRTTTSAR